jgi:hypothetical protein
VESGTEWGAGVEESRTVARGVESGLAVVEATAVSRFRDDDATLLLRYRELMSS